MLRWAPYLLLGTLILPAFAGAQESGAVSSKPTIDCTQARGNLARIICSGPEGANADWNLNAASWALRFSLDPNEREAFSAQETEWLRSLNQRCTLPTRPEATISVQASRCVLDAYRTRASEYRAKLKGDALAEANLSPEQRVGIQNALLALGFFNGYADGEFGPVTRRAIRSFLASNGMPEADFLSLGAQQKLYRDARTATAASPSGLRKPTPSFAQSAPDPNAIFQQMFGRITPGSRGVVFRLPNQTANVSPPSNQVPSVPNQTPHGIPRPSESRVDMPGPSAFPGSPTGRVDIELGHPANSNPTASRTVEVTASGDTPEAARKEATRLAIQQVAGVFVDHRRRVEINMSDQKVSQIVEEKVLSYTNAYVSKFEIVNSETKSDVHTVTAKVTVAVAPLLKTLQANNVPTVPFDSDSASATAETLTDEKAKALEIYRDLVSRLDSLIQVGIGKAEVSPSIPSAAGMAWVSIPITFFANKDAIEEWRKKFNLIADRREQVLIRVKSNRYSNSECASLILDSGSMLYRQDHSPTFLGQRPGSAQTGVATCFVAGATQGGLMADCFGRTFVLQTTARTRFSDADSFGLSQRSSLVRLIVEFVGSDGNVVYSLQTPFNNFPQIAVERSRSAPQGREEAFLNYCVAGNQGTFFRAHTNSIGSMPLGFGDTLIFPPVGSRINGLLNVLLPNEKIGQIASIRALLKSNP
jgi:peptidoglycan hydrolase-like protein with peptidoglycan-binding domain/uncharacterized protein YecT (DUF1311 family)